MQAAPHRADDFSVRKQNNGAGTRVCVTYEITPRKLEGEQAFTGEEEKAIDLAVEGMVRAESKRQEALAKRAVRARESKRQEALAKRSRLAIEREVKCKLCKGVLPAHLGPTGVPIRHHVRSH